MSDVAFSCPHCKRHLSASEDMEGRTISCPSCGSILTVPIRIAIPEEEISAHSGGANTCPYCRMPLGTEAALKTCPACHTPHHIECWADNKGCTVFGCPEAPEDEEKISVEPAASSGSYVPRATAFTPLHKTNAPGAVASLVWGILGLFICGLILGIVAISNANKAKGMIQREPSVYTGEGLATAGLVIGIIDLVFWGLILLAGMAGS